jgi:hypothetical protein
MLTSERAGDARAAATSTAAEARALGTKEINPLSIPLRPLQCVGRFCATDTEAIARFAHLNRAARECVIDFGGLERALPAAFASDAQRGGARFATIVYRALVAADRAAAEDEDVSPHRAYFEPSIAAEARRQGVAVSAQLLHAFRDVTNLPESWTLTEPLLSWQGVEAEDDFCMIPSGGSPGVIKIDLSDLDLYGAVDFTALPEGVTRINLNRNELSGAPDLSRLPRSLLQLWLGSNNLTGTATLPAADSPLEHLWLEHNDALGGVYTAKVKPNDFDFRGTKITVVESG